MQVRGQSVAPSGVVWRYFRDGWNVQLPQNASPTIGDDIITTVIPWTGAAMGVVFTSQAAQKIKRAVNKVLSTPEDRTNKPVSSPPAETEFWAWVTGPQANG